MKNKNKKQKQKYPIGTPLNIHDRDRNELYIGDKVRIISEDVDGIILYNNAFNEVCIFYSYSRWYGDDIYNPKSYGKCTTLKLDDGMRMNLVKLDM